MQKRKLISKISAGVLSGLLVMNGMFPTVAVLADEIAADTDDVSIVVKETEFSDTESIVAGEETEETTESDENDAAETEPSESVPDESSDDIEETEEAIEVSEDSIEVDIEPVIVETDPSETESTEETEVAEESSNDIFIASDIDSFIDSVAAISSDNRLIVQTTADISVGIENAIGAYFDGTYVISIADQMSYDNAISYFAENEISYAVDGSVSLCTLGKKIHLIKYADINPDATTRIAVIDTGSNVANESYSVIGDDTSDEYGHGTAMVNHILSQTDDAYIISIKAIGSDGTGNVSDICAAITMAENLDVDIILMALSVKDNGEYDALEQLIADAQANGIAVIASAGNNNSDASGYLPAGSDGVITVGALTEDGHKYSSSNFGSCVEYYIPATSTSEASAIFAGKYIDGDISNVATDFIDDEEESSDPIETETDLAEINFAREQTGVYIFITKEEMIAAGYTSSDEFRESVIGSADSMTGANYAQSGGNGSVGEKVDCITYTHIAFAQALGGISNVHQSGGKVYFDGSCSGWGPWKLYTTTGATGCTAWLSLHGIGSPNSVGVNPDNVSLSELGVQRGDLVLFGKTSTGLWGHAAIYDGDGTYFWQARGSAYTAGRSARSNVHANEDTTGYNRMIVLKIEEFEENSEMTITKSVADGYDVLTDGNSCYSLAGTTYTLYSGYNDNSGVTGAIETFTVGADGKTDTRYRVSPNTTYYIKETIAGTGFAADTAVYKIETGSSSSDPITVTNLTTGYARSISSSDHLFTIPMTDIPVTDPLTIRLDKITTTGQHTTADMNNAGFRIEYYAQDIAFDASVSGITPTAVFEFNLDGTSKSITLEFLAGLNAVSGSNKDYFKDINSSEEFSGTHELPIGTYRIYEIKAPDGYTLSSQVYRVRMYQTTEGSKNVRRQTGTEGAAPNGYNYFSHTLDESDPNYDTLKITLNETPVVGYFTLNKSMDDKDIIKNIQGLYTFELRNTTDNTLIATGVSQADGRVLWTYKVAGLYSVDNPKKLLTGTTTYSLELAVYNDDNVKINYEVRENIPTTAYGNTEINYSYSLPSGWSLSSNGKYFYKKVTLNSGSTYVATIKNNVEFANISINKAIPNKDTFDRTKVTFYLYNTDENVLIATGIVDSNGNIQWTKVATTGYGVDGYRTEINSVTHLPLGNYRVEEIWNRSYLESLDGKTIEIISSNNAGWTLDQRTTTTRYYKTFKLDKDGQTINFGGIENDEHVQWFNMTKTVTVDGDVGTITADLFYVADDGSYIKVATGTCTTSKGKGAYNFTWNYNGVSEMRSGLQTLKLPEGDYVVREYIPQTFYQNGRDNVPYTYMTPAGFTAVLGGNGNLPIYFEKNFHASNNATTVNSQSITNVRIEASLEIRKIEQAATIDRDFTFEIYYRGNGAEAQNIGVFSEKYLLDTVTVHCSNGSGMVKLDKIPEGWYEIIEVGASEWAVEWTNTDTNTDNGKLVHASSENGTVANPVIRDNVALFGVAIPGVLAYNRISIDVFVYKYDAWTQRVIARAGDHPENVHLTFHLYKDINNNGVLDQVEMSSFEVRIDADDEGKVIFDNLPAGRYILREVATVNGYYLTAPDIAFEVKDAVNFEAHPENTPYTEPVRVTKIDNETEENLSGAQFAVYVDTNDNGKWDSADKIAQAWIDQNGNKLIDDGEIVECQMIETSTGVYESNGELHFNDGSETFGNRYFIVEVKAPEGYFFVNPDGTFTDKSTYVAFTIDSKDTTDLHFQVGKKDFTFRNQTGTVYVRKVNEDGEFLSGAEFTVYSDPEGTEVIGKLVEDAKNGVYYYRGLGLGTYYIRETVAPEYYEADPNIYEFSITTKNVHPYVDNFTWDVIEGVHGDFVNHNPITGTTLTDSETEDHVGVVTETITLVDTVEYEGLHVGKTYVMGGTLYDRDTGEVLVDADEKPVTASVEFTPEETDGTVEVAFTFSLETARNRTIVAGEKVRPEDSDRYCGIHFDLKDEPQTVYFPEIHTTLIDEVTEDHVAQQREEITLIDTVAYENLVPGLEYVMNGTLMVKETGKPLTDSEGNPITASVKFTPNAKNGTVDVVFTFDADLLSGTTLVAFEELKYNGITVVTHNDINDVDQTVDIPEIHTSFYDNAIGFEEDIARNAREVTLIDRVYYENLTTGLEYTIYGTIMVKETGEPLRTEDGDAVMACTTFVATESTGYIDVEFVIDTTALGGKTLVAFETLDYNNVALVIHADLEDEEQTVYVPEIHTTLTQNGSHDGTNADTVTLIDVVSYENLIPGKTYTLTGTLMDKETGNELLGSDGKAITVITEFTPESANGSVEVTFTVPGSLLIGKTVVAFEGLSYENNLIAVHADIDDEGQTVKFPKPTPTPTTPPPYVTSTGEETPVSFYIGLGAVGLGAAISVIIVLKKRKDE